MSTNAADIDPKRIVKVLREAKAIAGESVPRYKLENRLLNIGLEGFVDDDIVRSHGLPFRFFSQLDEAIVAAAHFLDRFKQENGCLNIYAISRISKGEDRNLSFWQEAKAKLYIELQNMILLLTQTAKEDPSAFNNQHATTQEEKARTEREQARTANISRVFVFRELSDLAFLTQPAINVLSEQSAVGIKVGFAFVEPFQGDKKLLSDGVIIEYAPDPPTAGRHNFYVLYSLEEELTRADFPYQETWVSKWYLDENAAKAETEPETNNGYLSQMLDLFRHPWKELSLENAGSICALETKGEFFNDATVMMCHAFDRSQAQKNYRNPTRFITDRINKTVVSRDMMRLHRTMSAFTNAKNITAVDATSIKSSLSVHLSRPTYRDWLRRSLNRVLRSPENTLRRVYILKDHEDDDEVEYRTLLILLQYYLDYFHYEILDMAEIVHRHGSGSYRSDRAAFISRPWFQRKWAQYPERIKIYVTTTTALSQFTEDVMKDGISKGEYPEMFKRILQDDASGESDSLQRIDYLCTDDMIYNFINPRGDTDELQFPAFVYRSFLMQDEALKRESNALFEFMPRSLDAYRDFVVQNREYQLANSLVEYADNHKHNLAAERVTHADTLGTLKREIVEGQISAKADDLLRIRAEFEAKLYSEFRRHFDYLFEVLEFQSLEVKFWHNIDEWSVKNIYPFTVDGKAPNLTNLRNTIDTEIAERLKTKRIPELKPRADSNGKPTQPQKPTGTANSLEVWLPNKRK